MPNYEPHIWNLNDDVKRSHNCYSYFLNLIDKKAFNKCKTKKNVLQLNLDIIKGYQKIYIILQEKNVLLMVLDINVKMYYIV